ncbi:hypothetical protein GN330_22820 [Nitratireductor sp. CAU 1489]|uniref:Uncharacterized protein n=1 Tax=Nitratireductor arenosus TaxID=2682096 RepID=A0A844QKC5_9HYPH|nr:hypothetical protein [Nitratireductor arenosus]MVB00083.1 hypothetical protein [Nitratireductor arenosus]
MTRKLPPDDHVRALWASGMTKVAIAKRYGASVAQVRRACDRADGRGPWGMGLDHRFAAGRAPIDHRHTGEGAGYGKPIDQDDWYAAERLSKDDCRDLLNEWGIPCL